MEQNNTPGSLLKNTLSASFGLFVFAFGVHLTIRANIGAGPWDVFQLGLSSTLHILYGNASVTVSLLILLIDICLREKIGIGMILDAILVGKSVDLFDALNLIPMQQSLLTGIPMMLIGIVIEGYSQYFYMRSALGCGPRDTLLVGLKRKLPKIPLGLVSIALLVTVTGVGYLLGGPVGIGTLIYMFTAGPILQFALKTVRCDVTAIDHQSIPDTCRVLLAHRKKK